MISLQARSTRPVDHLTGLQAKPEDAAVSVTGDVRLFKPNGERLLVVQRQAVSQAAVDRAYPFLHWLRKSTTTNRGNYAGGEKGNRMRKDGVESNTSVSRPVRSAVVGHFDRYPRIPFCRPCALSSQHPEEWGECLPLIQEVSDVFLHHAPERYHAQANAAKKTHPAYVIPGTPFTTLTVNNTEAGSYHTDAGDYKPGFGVMLVLRRGSYSGCELVMPGYGVSVDMGDKDVILFDVHSLHGNTPFRDTVGPACMPEEGGHERISVVFYFRERMVECLSPPEELERAKARGQLSTEYDEGQP